MKPTHSFLSCFWSRPTLFLIALGALGLALGQPNKILHFPLATLAPVVCLFLLAHGTESTKTLFRQGWLLGTIGYCATLYWIAIPVNEIGGLPLPLAIPCVFFVGGYLGLFSGVTAVSFRWLQRAFGLVSPSGAAKQPGLLRILACAIFCGLFVGGVEFVLMSKLFTGFPWAVMATGFVAWPSWVQGASITGAYGLAAYYTMAAIIGTCAFLAVGKTRIAAGVLAFCLMAASPVYGKWRLTHIPAPSSPSLTFGIVQGNIDQSQKWDIEFQRSTIITYFTLSRTLMERADELNLTLDMLVWPETAMPFYYQSEDLLASTLRHFAASNNIALGFGTVGFQRKPNNIYKLLNRFQTISRDGTTSEHYDKQHLVPFGEYAPFTLPFEFLDNILQGMTFIPGTDTDPLSFSKESLNHENALGVLVCYEAIFPEIAQKQTEQGASVFLNISNDAWFGNTSAPKQHLAHTALRAVEQQRPIVRSTNTGYSAKIDAYGRISSSGPLFTKYASIIATQLEEGLTPFHNAFAHIQFLLAFGLAFPLLCGVYLRVFPKQP